MLAGLEAHPLALVADGVSLAILAWYLLARQRVVARGTPWPAQRAVFFSAGIVAVLVATGWGVASSLTSSFVLHVLAYLTLMNLAPILLALGAPARLALEASTPRGREQISRLLASRFAEVLTYPAVTAAIAYLTAIVYFLTPIYEISMRHPLLADYCRLQFVVAGCLYWWPVVGRDPMRWKMTYPVRLAYLATGIPINAMVGVGLTMNRASIDPSLYTVAETHLGGAVLWGCSEITLLAAIAVVYTQWSRWDRRQASDVDRALDRELASDREHGLAGGTVMDPRTGLWHYPKAP